MPRDSRPCVECGGGDDEGLVLLCEECDKPVHARCVGFAGPVENGWLCGECEMLQDQSAGSEGHESEDESEEEDASVAAPGA